MFISEKTLKLKYFSDTETPLLWINHDAILFIKYSEHTKINSYSFFFITVFMWVLIQGTFRISILKIRKNRKKKK